MRRGIDCRAAHNARGRDGVLQNFLTHSAWDYRGVMDQVAINANHCVGSEVGAELYVDESAFNGTHESMEYNPTSVEIRSVASSNACAV